MTAAAGPASPDVLVDRPAPAAHACTSASHPRFIEYVDRLRTLIFTKP